MNKSTLILILFLLIGCETNHKVHASEEALTGVVTSRALLTQYPEFKTEFDNYQPSAIDVESVQSLQGKKLVVLFGTWCHDSVREVPRLLKLLESSTVKLDELLLVAVNLDKQEPSNLHTDYKLEYTPTIILLDGVNELGRIVEKPVVSLGRDLAGFLQDLGTLGQ